LQYILIPSFKIDIKVHILEIVSKLSESLQIEICPWDLQLRYPGIHDFRQFLKTKHIEILVVPCQKQTIFVEKRQNILEPKSNRAWEMAKMSREYVGLASGCVVSKHVVLYDVCMLGCGTGSNKFAV